MGSILFHSSKLAQPQANSRDHMFQYDFIRAVSMLFVIAVHALRIIDFHNGISLFYFHVMQAVFFTCNGMFFMMSGKFALSNSKAEWKYYLRKIETIIIPMLLFFCLRTVYQFVTASVSFSWLYFLKNILGGLANTEYWFIFALLGNLLLAPLLGKAFRTWSKKEHVLFIVLGFLHNFFVWICAIFGLPYSYTMILGCWPFYFYLGYSIDHVFKKKHYPWLWLLGGLALAFTVVLKYIGITQYVHDISPVFTVFVISMYYLLYEAATFFSGKIRKAISFVARHSFTVYLCHMMILDTIQGFIPIVSGTSSIISHILLTILTLIGSIGIAAVVDKTIIKWLQLLFRRLVPKRITH